MTAIRAHPHAEFDRYPALLEDLAQAFGSDGLASTAARIIEAEQADFHWEGRIAEMNLGAFESFDEEDERFARVAILGYFHGNYYVAICIVDDERCVRWMTTLHRFASVQSAEIAFHASG
ncbi:MAG TPA: hypothetical protein VNF99_12400 [Stellaceae bacterium]|nr:hypothetical protein [Stellaceae bacterium]